MSDQTTSYEVLPEMHDDTGETKLVASFTSRSGIRIGILDLEEEGADWCEFDFTDDQAEAVGQALVRWAQRRRAEEITS